MDTIRNRLVAFSSPISAELLRLIEELETSPLTEEMVSNRHKRILIALYCVCDSEGCLLVHTGTLQIQKAINSIFKKQYSIGDINSFAHDLYRRGYMHRVLHEVHGILYTLSEKGIEFLEEIKGIEVRPFSEFKKPNIPTFLQ